MLFQQSLEHSLLPIPFSMLTVTGAWCPTYFGSSKRALYNIYSLFVFICKTLLIGEVFTYVVKCGLVGRFEPWPIFVLTTFMQSLYKFLSALRRNWIMSILHMGFKDRWQIPRDIMEEQIICEFRQSARKMHVIYITVLTSAASLLTILPVYMKAGNEIKLLAEVSFPYDVQVPLYFWLTYFHQTISLFFLSFLILSSDILLSAILLQVCLQLKLMKHRLIQYKELSSEYYGKMSIIDAHKLEHYVVKELVNDHLFIYNFSETINKSFFGWIVVLFAVGTPNLCINAYVSLFSTNFADIIISLDVVAVAFLQITLLCWCGNEVSVHTLDMRNTIYEMNWTHMSNSVKKDLALINLRASRPYVLKIGAVVPLNVDSMISIIKTSYTAFNVLKQSM